MTMQDWKGQKHSWPKRLPSERRIHPRVRTGFPVSLALQGGEAEDLPGVVADVSIGGMRVNVPRFLERGTEAVLAMTLAVTNRDGEQELHPFDAPVKVVDVSPEAPVEAGQVEEYELSLQFSTNDLERERIIGIFMLQTLLFQPEAKLSL